MSRRSSILSITIGALLFRRKTRERAVGICAAVIGLDAKKRERKEKILTLFSDRKELSNSNIRKSLGAMPNGSQVSKASVTRYMDELEREGIVEQVGCSGPKVLYKAK